MADPPSGDPLSSSSPAEPTLDETAPPVSLAEVVQESKERLAEAEDAPKTKRKYTKRKPKEPEVEETPAAFIPPVILQQVVGLPFAIWADRVQVPEVKLDAEEKATIAAQVDSCLREYMPQLSERAGILTVTIATIGMVTFSKAMIVQEAKAKRAKEVPSEAATPEPERPWPVTPSDAPSVGFTGLSEH